MYNSGHTSENGMSYAYAKQYHVRLSSDCYDVVLTSLAQDGVPFANAVANVAFKNGNAVSLGSSFINTCK